MMGKTWDSALSPHGGREGSRTLHVIFPTPIGRALQEREYDRVTIEITDDGLLLRPYATGLPRRRRNKEQAKVVLPEFS